MSQKLFFILCWHRPVSLVMTACYFQEIIPFPVDAIFEFDEIPIRLPTDAKEIEDGNIKSLSKGSLLFKFPACFM